LDGDDAGFQLEPDATSLTKTLEDVGAGSELQIAERESSLKLALSRAAKEIQTLREVTGVGQADHAVDLLARRIRTLSYRTFDKIRKVNQAAVVENKRLGPLLEMIKLYQDAQPQPERSRKGPKRRDQSGHMFSVG
jgi:hypothetical protein